MRLKQYLTEIDESKELDDFHKKIKKQLSYRLVKQKGKTKDLRGTEFDYIVYKTMELGKTIEAKYVDDMGFGLEADSLKELKEKISKIG